MAEFLLRFNYHAYVALVVIGLYALMVRRHLIRKLIGLAIFQTGIILFYVSLAAKESASIPILSGDIPPPTATIVNPLPHALMLTAVVVGVATLGVAIGILIRINDHWQELDEAKILAVGDK